MTWPTLDWTLLVLIIQTVFVGVGIPLVYRQTRAIRATDKTRLRREIVADIISKRQEAWERAPEVILSAPNMDELFKLAGGSPLGLPIIRGLHDFCYHSWTLRREKLIDDETWKLVELQIKNLWQSPLVTDVWNAIVPAGGYDSEFVQLVERLRRPMVDGSQMVKSAS